jgi:hypothetical protein
MRACSTIIIIDLAGWRLSKSISRPNLLDSDLFGLSNSAIVWNIGAYPVMQTSDAMD